MSKRTHISMAAFGAIACVLVLTGCGGVKHAKTAVPVPAATPTAAAPSEAREPAPPPAVIAPAPAAATVAAAPGVEPPPVPKATTVPPPRTVQKAANAPPPPPQPIAKAANESPPRPVAKAANASPSHPVAKAATVPSPGAAQLPPAPLDLESLKTRLKQTKAIGLLTKLSLKNQVDDLLARFRVYHARQGAATLPELRRSYDMLLLKVLSLLQDTDPPLAREIVQSRAAIWGILADPKKFNEANLMAGATT